MSIKANVNENGEIIVSNDLSFEPDTSKEAGEYEKLVMYLMMQIMAKPELSFYGHIISFFSYKFIKNGKERPDFDLGVEVKGTKVNLIINPFVFFQKSESEMMFRLIHEVEHVLRYDVLFNHKESIGYGDEIETLHEYITEKGEKITFRKRTPLANIAMDLAVNSLKYTEYDKNGQLEKGIGQDYLLKDGIFPNEGAFKDFPIHKLWEYYYERIVDKSKKNEDGFSMSDTSTESGNGNIIKVDMDKLGNGKLSESALNNAWGSTENMNQMEIETYKSFVQEVIQEAIEKSAGNVPGHYKKLIERLTMPKFDWKRAIKLFIARGHTIEMRPSKRKINKRAINLKSFVRGWVSKKDCNVGAAIDTSGSISYEQFCNSINHLMGIRKSTNADVWVMAFDAEVHYMHKLENKNMKKILSTEIQDTQGGTMFYPIFEKIMEEKPFLDCLIIFTDGYNFDKEKLKENPLKIPVLWVYTEQHEKQPFGKHVVMTNEQY